MEHFGEKFGGIGLSFTTLLILFFTKDNGKRSCNLDKETPFTRDENVSFCNFIHIKLNQSLLWFH